VKLFSNNPYSIANVAVHCSRRLVSDRTPIRMRWMINTYRVRSLFTRTDSNMLSGCDLDNITTFRAMHLH